jgi:hypothetical protein
LKIKTKPLKGGQQDRGEIGIMKKSELVRTNKVAYINQTGCNIKRRIYADKNDTEYVSINNCMVNLYSCDKVYCTDIDKTIWQMVAENKEK